MDIKNIDEGKIQCEGPFKALIEPSKEYEDKMIEEFKRQKQDEEEYEKIKCNEICFEKFKIETDLTISLLEDEISYLKNEINKLLEVK